MTHCCQMGTINCISFLLDRGAEVNTVDMFGATPIQFAYALKFDDVVSLLLKHGADESYMETIPTDISQVRLLARLNSVVRLHQELIFENLLLFCYS